MHFDPKTFAQMTFNQANDTVRIPVPVGDQPGTITRYDILTWEKKDKSDGGLKLNVYFDIDSDAVRKVTGRDKNICRYEFFLDTNDVGLDFGKGMNVALGKLRKAVDLNEDGVPFAFDMMIGRRALCSIGHDEYKGDTIAEVRAVAHI